MSSSASKHREELDVERVRILFDNVKFGYLGVVSSVTLLAFVVVRYASAEVATLWVAAVTLANLPRVITSVQFERRTRARAIEPR